MERLTGRELNGLGGVHYNKCHQENCHGNCANCEIIREAELKLKLYEDLEELGLLLRLPCKVWDIVFVVGSKCLANKEPKDWCLNCDCEECMYDKEMVVFEMKVQYWLLEHLIMRSNENWMLNKTVFFTKEEAEQALARMEKSND